MSDTINAIIKAALDYAYNQNSAFLVGLNRSNLELEMQAAFEAVVPTVLTLDSTQPDFEAVYLRLVQELQAKPTWLDIIPSGAGMTLLRNISAGIAYNNFGIERGLQESFPQIAFSDSGIAMGTRMLGVRLQRRIPSRVNTRLTRPDDGTIVTIPALSQFIIRGFDFFNRDQIVFNSFDVSVNATLYQGTIRTLEGIAEGIPYETIEIGSENGQISNEDIYVKVSGVDWERRAVGMYHFLPQETSFFEDTLPNSNVEVVFGNGAFGAVPPLGSPVAITWVETEGLAADFPTIGLQISQKNAQSGIDVTGETLSNIYGGAEAKSLGFYKAMAPHIRAANNRAVRRSDYRAVALKYPNVVDALWRGQAELNPGKRNWMNILGATILTSLDTPWNNLQWDDFIAYMRENGIYQTEILRMDPTPVDIAISGKVYCRPQANLELVKNKLLTDVSTAFGPRLNALGYSVFQSDIADVLEGKNEYEELVEYVTDIVPSADATVSGPTQYVRVTSVTLEMFYTTRGGFTGRRDLM